MPGARLLPEPGPSSTRHRRSLLTLAWARGHAQVVGEHRCAFVSPAADLMLCESTTRYGLSHTLERRDDQMRRKLDVRTRSVRQSITDEDRESLDDLFVESAMLGLVVEIDLCLMQCDPHLRDVRRFGKEEEPCDALKLLARRPP